MQPVVSLVAIADGAFFVSGFHHRMNLEARKASQASVEVLYAGIPVIVIVGFLAIYISCIQPSPGAVVLGLAAGVNRSGG